MSNVLTDLFSISSFSKIYDTKVRNFNFTIYKDSFSLIENLIICNKIVLDKNGVSLHQLDGVCSKLSENVQYIEDKRLYEITQKNIIMHGNDINLRGLVYADVAKEHDIYYSPHPDREYILTEKILKCVNLTALNVIEKFDQRFNESNSGIISNINIKTPPIVEHVLYYSKNQNITILDSINEIRSSKNAIKFRDYFNQLDGELSNVRLGSCK